MIPKFPKGYTNPLAEGEGVFSSVYRVRQTSLDRWVAIKILKEKDKKKREDQLEEARIQAGIRVNCVPEVFDVFEWKRQVVIVMQWIRGVRLSELLKTDLSPDKRLWIAEGIIRAAANLHGHGLAHCDLKPANILVSPKEGMFLVDFGFSRKTQEGSVSFSGPVKGTPAYMAPELWLGKEKIDFFRADLYSIGKILKQVLEDLPAESIVHELLREEPQERPENGGVLLQKWNNHSGRGLRSPDWSLLAEPETSRLLADKLFKAVGKMLRFGRIDEAYWTLVECLEEQPEHREGLELIDRFPGLQKRKRRTTMTILGLAFAVPLLLCVVFFLGKSKGRINTEKKYNTLTELKSRSLLLPDQSKGGRLRERLFLRNLNPLTSRLAARLVVPGPLPAGKMMLDGGIILHDRLLEGITIAYGKHKITWLSEEGEIIWSEGFSLLPFQTRTVQLPEFLFR